MDLKIFCISDNKITKQYTPQCNANNVEFGQQLKYFINFGGFFCFLHDLHHCLNLQGERHCACLSSCVFISDQTYHTQYCSLHEQPRHLNE